MCHTRRSTAALSAWRRKQRQALVSDVAQARNADALDGMSWREFELLVGEAYRLQGYRVTEIGGGGPDGGVDLVLAKGSEKFFVQCKQWKAYKVGVTTVRELYGVMAAKGATGGFVVTSGRFTTDAKDFAQGRNIELVDGPRLFAMIQQARSTQGQPAAAQRETSNSMESPAPQPQSAVQAPQATAKAAAQPECPCCGAAMALRTARQGANAGNTFWGCTTYPKCRGARLKQARLNAGLSQKMLGIEAGIDAFVASTRINRYELGIHRPDLLTVRKLAKVLNVPVAFFFADEDDEIAELLLLYKKAGTPVRTEILKMLACS